MQNSKIEIFYQAYNTGTGAEDLRYYYQHDHLGSASVVTLKTGKTDQYLQYLPYGELFVSQKNHSFDSRYKFSAKELDNETGYSYFGARYYDSDLRMWLSVYTERVKANSVWGGRS